MIVPKYIRGRQRSEGASSPMNILVVVIDSQGPAETADPKIRVSVPEILRIGPWLKVRLPGLGIT